MHKSPPAENSTPSLYHIVKNPDSLAWLKSNPSELLFASSADLNQVALSGPNKGESALFWLCLFYHDNQLLDKIPSISSKITLDGLNAIIESGPFKGYSALYALSSSSAGRDFLSMIDPNIIQPSALTSQIYLPILGRSALWYLTQFKPDILASTAHGTVLLRQMSQSVTIDQQFLSLVITKGPNQGRSVEFVINGNSLLTSTAISASSTPNSVPLSARSKTMSLHDEIKSLMLQCIRKKDPKLFFINKTLLNTLSTYVTNHGMSLLAAPSSSLSPTIIRIYGNASNLLTGSHLDIILPHLPALTEASFYRCENISTIRALEHCSGLTSLNLSWCSKLQDLEPFSNLFSLTTLNLTGTKVSNLSPLSGLSALTSLDLENTEISDLSPLSGLSALTSLTLACAKDSDLSTLPNLSTLTSLDLSWCQKVKDLKPLSQLSALTSLKLTGTKDSDLSTLPNLSTLTSLDLDYTNVSNLSSLSSLSALTSLSLWSTPVSDLSPLDSLPGLRISGK